MSNKTVAKWNELAEVVRGQGFENNSKNMCSIMSLEKVGNQLSAEVERLEKELHAAKVELVMRGGRVEADINNNGVMMVSVVAKSGEPNANGDIFLDTALSDAVEDIDYPDRQRGRCQAILLQGKEKCTK